MQPKPHSMNSQWQLSSSVPCACHSPLPHGHGLSCATAGPHPSSCVTIPRAKLLFGETFTGFWQDHRVLNEVLSKNNHQHCCSDTHLAQQQLQPDKHLCVCVCLSSPVTPKSLSLMALRNQDTTATSKPQFPCWLCRSPVFRGTLESQ